MRILHIATLFSADGAYGGPTRVAVNQATALRDRGHEVTVAGAVVGAVKSPTGTGGVPFRGFPVRTVVPGNGFSGISARGLMCYIGTNHGAIDLVHVHVGRDLVTLPALRLAQCLGIPTVAQPHGMIGPHHRLAARPLDAILTRPALRNAGAVLHLTPEERNGLTAVAGETVRLVEVHNGVPPGRNTAAPAGREVLFLARLHERKRPDLFVRVASDLAPGYPEATFTVVGPDGGYGLHVDRGIAAAGSDRVTREEAVPPDEVSARLGRAFLYVLPSVAEPYPMSVLEAMAAARPVIVTSSCGLADMITRLRCGIVVSESEESLRCAIDTYLREPARAAADGARGAVAAHERFGMDAIAGQLERCYEDVVSWARAGSNP